MSTEPKPPITDEVRKIIDAAFSDWGQLMLDNPGWFEALRRKLELQPPAFLARDIVGITNFGSSAGFGTTWPTSPVLGSSFILVDDDATDAIPLYHYGARWNGIAWVSTGGAPKIGNYGQAGEAEVIGDMTAHDTTYFFKDEEGSMLFTAPSEGDYLGISSWSIDANGETNGVCAINGYTNDDANYQPYSFFVEGYACATLVSLFSGAEGDEFIWAIDPPHANYKIEAMNWSINFQYFAP